MAVKLGCLSAIGGRISEVSRLIGAITASQQMASLWSVHDAGMPVFVHTIDVTLLAIEEFPEWQSRYGDMDVLAVTIGSLLHDLTKATCRAHREYTHSWVMSNQPEMAMSEAMDAMDAAQLSTGIPIDQLIAEHVAHIVASHHGPWGMVKPATPEAALVHRCDLISAQHHRVAPVDANDILPLLAKGLSKAATARHLGVGSSVVRSRLADACDVEGMGSVADLLVVWGAMGSVRVGSVRRAAQLERARWLMAEAKNLPQAIVGALVAMEGVHR